MQKRIFVIWGIAGVGKTTTLKLIAREIMRNYFGAIPDSIVEPLPAGDITVVINIGNVKIGITSQGDPGTGLYNRLKELAAVKKCDIIFCASRTSGTTVEDVERIEREENFRATWLNNYQTGFNEERPFLNQRSAEDIVSLMRHMCQI